MQKSLMKILIKSNLDKEKEAEKLIDEFIKTQAKVTRVKLEEFLSELFVFIYSRVSLDKELLLPLISDKLNELNLKFETKNIELIYEKIALMTTSAIGVKFSFDKIDLKAIEAMRKNFYWIEKSATERVQNDLKDFIEKAFKGEVARSELPNVLKEHFKGLIEADSRYFADVSDHVISQSQNISRVIQASKYKIKKMKVVAVIDSQTSKICRSMNGRVIEVSKLLAQTEKILNANSIEEKKEASIWLNSEMLEPELPENFGVPPYHFKCRTHLIVVNFYTKEIDGKKINYTELHNKNNYFSHIDKLGVERVVSNSTREHIKVRHPEVKDKHIISALNSIREIAPHKENRQRFVAKSDNGFFMVFEANLLVSIFKAGRKNYFRDNAIGNKKVVLKWKKQESSKLTLLKELIGLFAKKI